MQLRAASGTSDSIPKALLRTAAEMSNGIYNSSLVTAKGLLDWHIYCVLWDPQSQVRPRCTAYTAERVFCEQKCRAQCEEGPIMVDFIHHPNVLEGKIFVFNYASAIAGSVCPFFRELHAFHMLWFLSSNHFKVGFH